MTNFYQSRSSNSRSIQFILIVFIFSLISCHQKNEENKTLKKPNILLIVADDLGYADLGCYGGDIETPNIDSLALSGIRFSDFNTAPMCAPTRAMLLSGTDNHTAGMGVQGKVTTDFGYEGMLSNRIIPVPQLLKTADYHTYIAGKWHLGMTPEANPNQKGFDRSFVLIHGAGNHYTNQSALGSNLSMYTEDGKPTEWYDGNYSTDFYTDKIIEYIESNKNDKKPFFAFAAYTSPHWPLQVDKKFSDKYKGRYNDGYEKLKEQRLKSLKKAGIIPEKTNLPPNHKRVKSWDSLSDSDKIKEAKKMELYAGMVDNLDYNIGKLISYLKHIGEYENTVIVFMSDNGAAHRDFINSKSYASLRTYYNDDYDNMGSPNSYISYGPQWAEAGSSPFRYFKDYATQGGINTPMIISGPNIKRKNTIHHGFVSVMDLAPTFYELAEVEYPKVFDSIERYPLKGSSLISFVSKKQDYIHNSNYVFALEHAGNATVRKGNWKITNFKKPFKVENFGLYNLDDDLGEQYDLKTIKVEKYRELLEEWHTFSTEIKLHGTVNIGD